MDKCRVTIQPRSLHYESRDPVDIKVLFKRIIVSSNQETEKYECRKSFGLRNGICHIQDHYQFTLSRETELNNTKVCILLFALRYRQLSFIGDVTIDLKALTEMPQGEPVKFRLQKSSDPKAYLFVLTHCCDEVRRIKESPFIQQCTIFKSESYYKETYELKRKVVDLPSAYEISRKKYKKQEMAKNKDTSAFSGKEGSKEGSQSKGYSQGSHLSPKGSYKRRFEYEAPSKSKKTFPRPRNRTPQPINQKIVQTPEPRIIPQKSQVFETIQKKSLHGSLDKEELKEAILSIPNGVEDYSSIEKEQENFRDINQKLESIKDKIQSQNNKLSPHDSLQQKLIHQNGSGQLQSQEPTEEIKGVRATKKGSNGKEGEKKSSEAKTLGSPEDNFSPTVRKVTPQPFAPEKSTQEFLIQPSNKDLRKQSVSKKTVEQADIIRKLEEELQVTRQVYDKEIDKLVTSLEEHRKQEELMPFKIVQFKALESKIQEMLVEIDAKDQLIKKLNLANEEIQEKAEMMRVEYETKLKELEEGSDELLQSNMELERQMLGVDVKEKKCESDKSYLQEYLAEQKRAVNLQSQLKYKENQFNFMKMERDNFKKEKDDLEIELDCYLAQNDKESQRSRNLLKVGMDSRSVATSVRLQNQILKKEISLLQEQVEELNFLLEGFIRKREGSGNMALDRASSKEVLEGIERSVLPQKYHSLEAKLQAVEEEYANKKMKLAEIINLVWKDGNPKLIDAVNASIGLQ